MDHQIIMVSDPTFSLEDLINERKQTKTLEQINSTVVQTLQDYYGLPSFFLVGGIVLHFFGIVVQGFVIAYECWQIDPMEQSFSNMVINSIFQTVFEFS